MIAIKHDNNSEKLAEIRKAKSVDEVHQIATKLGLIASHTFDMKWISLSETPTSEDIFVAIEVGSVEFGFEDEYKLVEYPVRTFKVEIDGEEQDITIATESLSEAMGDDKEVEDTEANDLDCTIYFYVADDVIGLDADVICKEHLDEPMTFIEEIF